jgi:hypothetical protein
MSTFKTLALAAFAAMSVGVGAAMAQEGTSMPDAHANYGPIQQFHASIAQTPTAPDTVQSGSADVDTNRWAGSGFKSDSPYYDQQ